MENEQFGREVYTFTCRNAEKGLSMVSQLVLQGINHLARKGEQLSHGEQGLEDLKKHKQSLSFVDISGNNELNRFRQFANYYNMDFAVKHNLTNGDYTLFFKVTDAEIMEKVFKEYSKTLEKDKPSISQQLEKNEKRREVAIQKVQENSMDSIGKNGEKINESIDRGL